MSDKKGVDNVKEVLELMFLIVTPILEEIKKDGFQPSDLLAFLDDPAFRDHLVAAVVNINELPSEIKNIGMLETFELGRFLINEIRGIIKKM